MSIRKLLVERLLRIILSMSAGQNTRTLVHVHMRTHTFLYYSVSTSLSFFRSRSHPTSHVVKLVKLLYNRANNRFYNYCIIISFFLSFFFLLFFFLPPPSSVSNKFQTNLLSNFRERCKSETKNNSPKKRVCKCNR